MHHTIFDTPIIKTLLYWLASLILLIFGWKASGEKPQQTKYVLIAAPHTTNWDLIFMLLIALRMKIKIYWMGKATIFSFPFRGLMKWMGGIPIDRSQSNNVVEAMVGIYNKSVDLVVTVPPEGTRKHVSYWKTGFYHIAHGANVPICLGFLDYKKKIGGIGPLVQPCGDIEKDMKIIKSFYDTVTGKYPNRYHRENS